MNTVVISREQRWLVWSPTGTLPPRFEHPSEREARTEAARLAKLHPGQVFHVCAIGAGFVVAKTPTMIIVETAADDIPF